MSFKLKGSYELFISVGWIFVLQVSFITAGWPDGRMFSVLVLELQVEYFYIFSRLVLKMQYGYLRVSIRTAGWISVLQFRIRAAG